MFFWFGLAPWIWGFEFVLFVGLIVLVEFEFYKWSTATLIGALVLSHFLHAFSVVDLVRHNPGTSFIVVLSYFPAGTIWATFKWFLFLYRFKDARMDALDEFHDIQEAARARIASGAVYTMDEELVNKTDYQYLRSQYFKKTNLSKIPRVRDYKRKVIGWIAFCVFSIVGTIFHDLVRRIALWIYNRVSSFLQWMSNRIISEVEEIPEKT